MANKNVILKMRIEDVLQSLMVQTGADNVIVDSSTNKTLATALAEITADLNAAVAGGLKASEVQEMIDVKITALINGAPEAMDTLKELGDLITNNADAMQVLNEAIGNKVDKVTGKGLSTNDFTNALAEKLNGIATGATKTAKSTKNGNILINDQEVVVYTHPTGAGNNHIPTGGTVGQVLRASGNGVGAWGDNVRSGTSTPDDLANGELFVQIL